jgi:alkylhydroperoxidase/carboxymuconolactone decarboxylase family protein YurZ
VADAHSRKWHSLAVLAAAASASAIRGHKRRAFDAGGSARFDPKEKLTALTLCIGTGDR